MKVNILVRSRDEKKIIGRIPGEQVGTTPTGLVRVKVEGRPIKAVAPRNVEVAE